MKNKKLVKLIETLITKVEALDNEVKELKDVIKTTTHNNSIDNSLSKKEKTIVLKKSKTKEGKKNKDSSVSKKATGKKKKKSKSKKEPKVPKDKVSYIQMVYETDWTVYKGNKIEKEYTRIEESYHKVIGKVDIKSLSEKDQDDISKLGEDSGARLTGFKLKEHNVVNKSRYNEHNKPIKFREIASIKPYSYKYTLVDDMNIPQKDGECVPNAIYNMYKKHIPTLTIEKICDILNKGCQMYCIENHKYHNIMHIKSFCQTYNISHSGLDIKNQVIEKEIYKGSNYPSFIFYVIDNHLYLVRDKKTRMSIVNRAKNGTLSLMAINEPQSDTNKNAIFEDIPLE